MQQPFPESLRETNLGSGPDFPGSSGDRERGKFRPSKTRRLTALAVVGDDGLSVAQNTEQRLEEMLLYQRAILQALVWLASDNVTGFSVEDVLATVS